jgi:hypothetical protein
VKIYAVVVVVERGVGGDGGVSSRCEASSEVVQS